MVEVTVEQLIWTVCGIGAVAVGLVLLVPRQSSRKRWQRLPPGPRPWPVLGNLGELGLFPHADSANLSKTYGPLFHLWMGSAQLVVANSIETAKEILKTQDLNFASRPKSTTFKEISYDYGTISFAPHGQLWRHLRRVLVVELLAPRRLKEFEPVRTEEIRIAVQRIIEESNGEKAVTMIFKIKEHLANILTRMMMSKRFFGPEEEREIDSVKFQAVNKGIISLLGVIHLGDYIPLFKRWDVQGNMKRFRDAHSQFDKFLQDVVDERRKTIAAKKHNEDAELLERGDFLDVLLLRSGVDDDVPLTDTSIKAIFQDAILGGVDTTASSLEWALAEVLAHPNVLQKAQEELDLVVGRERLVEESDVPKLNYITFIVKESFRLHPPSPMLLPRCSSDDVQVGGFHIPAGCQTFVNVWAIGRDPQLWDKPLDYNPERFLDSSKDVTGFDYDLLPFGSGRRKCPGMSLGLMQVQWVLAFLIQNCVWVFPEGQSAKDIDMTEEAGLVCAKAHHVEAIVKLRLPKHVLYPNSAASN